MTKEMLACEDTFKDIEKTLGAVPSLMKFFPEENSWKSLGKIDMERVRFLLSTDEMIEEMLSVTQDNIVPTSIKPHATTEVAQEDSA